MEIDVTKALRAIRLSPEDDGVLKDPGGKEVTLRQVLLSSLIGPGPRCPRCGTFQFASDTQDGDMKLKLWMLAQRIERATKHVELSNVDVTTLKKVVANNQSTIVSGQVWEILDPVGAKQSRKMEEEDGG